MTQEAYPERYETPDMRPEFLRQRPLPTQDEIRRALHNKWAQLVGAGSKRLLIMSILAITGLAAYHFLSAPRRVEVVRVNAVNATQTLGAIGKVRGERVSELGLDAAGTIQQIYVRAGDYVQTGQPILSLDNGTAQQKVAAARAVVANAGAELAKVSRGPLPSEIGKFRAELAQATSVGDAKIAQAEARLRHLNAGNRPQEIAAAQAELQSRQDILTKAQKDLQRTQTLVTQGALAKANLDGAQTDVQTARAAVIAQQQRVSLLKAGPTADELAEARAAVAEARASRDTAAAVARESLNTVTASARPEDLTAARARVEQANAELQQAVDAMGKTELRAPFAGVVSEIPVETGRSVSPGEKLVSLQELGKPMVEVETDEGNLNDLAIGQTATITSDAYPGQSFNAVLTDLGSNVNADRGTITIKLRPVDSVSWLRPDLTVNVNIVTKRSVSSIIVPPDALVRYKGASNILVARKGRAVPIRVTTGATGASGIVVTGSIKNGDLVIRNASEIQPNGKVSPREAAAQGA